MAVSNNNFSSDVEKIVNNYMKRLKRHLRGLSEKDQTELVKEIHSHIYESYAHDGTKNEIERIFNVLDKLGEPAEVVSARVSPAMVSMGKKRKWPLYILAGFLITVFGLPLGISGIAILFSALLVALVLILTVYVTGITLVVAGWIGAVMIMIRNFNPDFLEPWIEMTPLVTDTTFNSVLYVILCLLVAALGVGLLWLGRHIMHGTSFLLSMPFEKIREARRRSRLRSE